MTSPVSNVRSQTTSERHEPANERVTPKQPEKAPSSVLSTWARWEQETYTPGSDAICEQEQVCYSSDTGGTEAHGKAASDRHESGTRLDAYSTELPSSAGGSSDGSTERARSTQTYEQCVNQAAYEGLMESRVLGAFGGCALGGLAGAGAGVAIGKGAPPVVAGLAALGCIGGAMTGYYSVGGDGASSGEVAGRVHCDTPDRPGSPSSRVE